MKKVVIGLSGGMDSATLLGYFLEQGYEVHCCLFFYGSKHGTYERLAALEILKFYKERGFPVFEYLFDISCIFSSFSSNLLMSGEEIPEGRYEASSMKLTVVPGRNLIFASIMAGLAESKGITEIGLGIHSGDHHIYPDCRPEFMKTFNMMMQVTEVEVKMGAPFLMENKTSILQMGYSFANPVPYQLTRTCYKNQPYSCGKCGSCQERLEAFANINKTDPITYATETY